MLCYADQPPPVGNLLPLLWPRLPETKDVAVTDITHYGYNVYSWIH